MRLESPWTPHLASSDGPPSERLAEALATDILDGILKMGDRLPPHRNLAWNLKIGVGTVTKAYAVLERRGLIVSEKGRGTFVARLYDITATTVDLSVNSPPAMLSERQLSKTLVLASKKVDSKLFVSYPPPAGHEAHRRLMARWLTSVRLEADPNRLLLTNGAQQALSVALTATRRPDSRIFTERFTYPGMLTLARVARYDLCGLPIDDEGLCPKGLASALSSCDGLAVVYLTPTLHNPTTATMGETRRREIVDICRRYEAIIIEDDVYGVTANIGLPTLTQLAPERAFYITSLSKCFCPGLRIGVLIAPANAVATAAIALRSTGLSASSLSCAVVEQWVADGTAKSLSASIRTEASRRVQIARAYLGVHMVQPVSETFHIWLPMERRQADRLAANLAQAGILVAPPERLMTDPRDRQSGVRVSLGSPPLEVLRQSLAAISRCVAQVKSAEETVMDLVADPHSPGLGADLSGWV